MVNKNVRSGPRTDQYDPIRRLAIRDFIGVFNVPPRFPRRRAVYRHEQHTDAQRFDVHARDLRSRIAEPQRSHSRRARGVGLNSLRLPSRARNGPGQNHGANRLGSRRGVGRARVRRDHTVPAKGREQRGRRIATIAGPRPSAIVHVELGTYRPVRSSLDSALSRSVLRVPFLARHNCACRHDRARGITAITEAKTRSPLKEAAYFAQARNALAEAGAGTPRCCERWAWEVGSPPGGPSQIANACPDPRALATSPVTLEPSPRWRAWRCNPWSSALAHIW